MRLLLRWTSKRVADDRCAIVCWAANPIWRAGPSRVYPDDSSVAEALARRAPAGAENQSPDYGDHRPAGFSPDHRPGWPLVRHASQSAHAREHLRRSAKGSTVHAYSRTGRFSLARA